MSKGKLLVKSNTWQALYDLNTGLILDQNRLITEDRVNEFLQPGEIVSVDWANESYILHFSYFPERVNDIVWSNERF